MTEPPDDLVIMSEIVNIEHTIRPDSLREWVIIDYLDIDGVPRTVYVPRIRMCPREALDD